MPVVHPQDESKRAELRSLPADTPTVRVKGLDFHYPDGRHALRGVSLQIHPQEKVALVGPNGAGKSTFLLHLNGVLQGNGYIEIGGLTVEETNLPVIRARVGLVFQNPDDQLFSPTVFDDVAFGPLHMGYDPGEVRARVADALAQVGMDAYSERLSHHLSMGEKKRIAIATVLSMQPDILVLDEPTAGLDPRSRRNLIHLLDDMPRTMLVSTHDMALVEELFPRMVIMDQGEIVADGATKALLSDEGLLQRRGLR